MTDSQLASVVSETEIASVVVDTAESAGRMIPHQKPHLNLEISNQAQEVHLSGQRKAGMTRKKDPF